VVLDYRTSFTLDKGKNRRKTGGIIVYGQTEGKKIGLFFFSVIATWCRREKGGGEITDLSGGGTWRTLKKSSLHATARTELHEV